MMKIVVLGATGYVGKRLLSEALRREHVVTAVARNTDDLPTHTRLHPLKLDISDTNLLRSSLTPHDVVVVAMKCDGLNEVQLLESIKRSAVPRVLLIGGAGSLLLSADVDLVDSDQMPSQYRAEALAAREW